MERERVELMLEQDVRTAFSKAILRLVALGSDQGYVTVGDVVEHLPEVEDEPELLDVVATRLEQADIELERDETHDNGDRNGSDDSGFSELIDTRPVSLEGIDSDDTISLYFREVGSVPLLTREEEVALAKRIEHGRETRRKIDKGGLSEVERRELERACQDGQAAWDHLVKANSRLVISMAKKYRGQGVPFLDLIQEGNVGLMKAADKFDYCRGYKFSTYATWWIRQAITRALANQGRTIRVPVHMSDRIRKLFAIAQAMEQDLGRRPTPAEIAVRMEVPEVKVRQMLRVARRSLSLEKPVGEEQDSELGHFIEDNRSPDPLEEAAYQLLQGDLDDLLQCLTAREARILRLRFGLDNGQPHTLKQVGKKFNLTRERIRQIEQEALYKLRHPRRRAKLMNYLH
ncbi:MAG: sigma-70 family RNA polymerase sigma factor [Anaerolineae bacterium]